MTDDYLDQVELDTERLALERLIDAATADERALQAALAGVDPSVDWTALAPDKLPSPAGDPLANQLAVTAARNDYLRSRWNHSVVGVIEHTSASAARSTITSVAAN